MLSLHIKVNKRGNSASEFIDHVKKTINKKDTWEKVSEGVNTVTIRHTAPDNRDGKDTVYILKEADAGSVKIDIKGTKNDPEKAIGAGYLIYLFKAHYSDDVGRFVAEF